MDNLQFKYLLNKQNIDLNEKKEDIGNSNYNVGKKSGISFRDNDFKMENNFNADNYFDGLMSKMSKMSKTSKSKRLGENGDINTFMMDEEEF